MTRIRSESDRISSSSNETSRIARPSSRSLDEAPVDELDRADVEPAGRLRRDQHGGLRETSRAITTFCWLPPESDAARRLRRAAAHVELLQQRFAVR